MLLPPPSFGRTEVADVALCRVRQGIGFNGVGLTIRYLAVSTVCVLCE
jgi:hypothetical protein